MKKIHVKSLPFKDVIQEISEAFSTDFTEKCDEYSLQIPESFGEGVIRGINFNNGLGIIIYDCAFLVETEIRFTKNDIHPVKYLYTAKGKLSHRFAEETKDHKLEKFSCAIVASKDNKGHILKFNAQEPTFVLSLEIDRKKFFSNLACELSEQSEALKKLFRDENATTQFYHQGFYSIAFENLINSLQEHQDEKMIRKLFLEAKALEIFINQIRLFEDDLLPEQEKLLLRQDELTKIRESAVYINQHLDKILKVEDLAQNAGLNPNKLQNGFKYLFHYTVNEYVMQQRMLKAATLLKTTDLNLGVIADEIGITSKSYFSKSFKKHYGVLPSEYLKQL